MIRVKRLLFDTDGVLAKWNWDISPEKNNMHLLKEGHYFLERPEQENIVNTVHYLSIYRRSAYVLYNITAVLIDAKNAWSDKHKWDDKVIPEIDREHRIFLPCGEDKIDYVPDFDPWTNILIDDYGENCRTWASHGGTYIKVSVNAEDAEYEKKNHKYVIHPDMTVDEIVAVIDKVSEDMDVAYEESEKDFDIEYVETYSEVYVGIKGRTFEEAADRLDEMIRDGAVEGPRYCTSSEYIDRTNEGGAS